MKVITRFSKFTMPRQKTGGAFQQPSAGLTYVGQLHSVCSLTPAHCAQILPFHSTRPKLFQRISKSSSIYVTARRSTLI